MRVPLLPKPGVNSDDTTFAAEGRWADGNNFRFVHGLPQVRGGSEDLFTLGVSAPCRAILPFNRSGSISVAYGLTGVDAKLFVGTGVSTPVDRTPSLAVVPESWSLAPWGSTLLAAPEGGPLYEQSGSGTATEVTQSPNAITHMLVTPQRQVMALGCNEEGSGTFNALCIRWSDLENYSDWTSSSSNNAGEYILDGGGRIVAGRVVGQYVAIWTTSALYLGQYLGDPRQTYRFDKVSDDCGLAGPNAVVIFRQTAYWIGPDLRARSWAVGTLPQTMPCSVWHRFTSRFELLTARYVVASANARFNEIRFDYRDGIGGGFPSGNIENRYISVALEDGCWHLGAGGRTAMVDCGDIASLTAGYTDGPTILAARGASFPIIALEETGVLEWSSGTPAELCPFVKSADQYLDSGQRRLTVHTVYPDFEDQSANVTLTIFCRDHPQSPPITKGPYTLMPTTGKKDLRASGKLVAVKISGVTGGSQSLYVRLGKLVFDVVPMGER